MRVSLSKNELVGILASTPSIWSVGNKIAGFCLPGCDNHLQYVKNLNDFLTGYLK
jgi:hypothetical protein